MPDAGLKPWLAPGELERIRQHLTDEMVALEWGSGGSTVELAPLVRRWCAIEHDYGWQAQVRKALPDVSGAQLVHLPPEVEEPSRPSRREDWVRYVEGCRWFETRFGFVLIDGRARPECALEVLPLLEPGALVALHDWHDQCRPHYRAVLDHYDLIEELPVVDRARYGAGMALLRPRSS